MRSFNDWYFDLFESGNGAYLNQQEIAEEAWQHQQCKVDELKLKLSEYSRILHNVIEIERKKNDELQKRVDASLIAFENLKEEINELHGQCDLHLIKYLEEKSQVLEQALKSGEDASN